MRDNIKLKGEGERREKCNVQNTLRPISNADQMYSFPFCAIARAGPMERTAMWKHTRALSTRNHCTSRRACFSIEVEHHLQGNNNKMKRESERHQNITRAKRNYLNDTNYCILTVRQSCLAARKSR